MFTPNELDFINEEIDHYTNAGGPEFDIALSKYNWCPLCSSRYYARQRGDHECSHNGGEFFLITGYYLAQKIATLMRRVNELEGALQYERSVTLLETIGFIERYTENRKADPGLQSLISEYQKRKIDKW